MRALSRRSGVMAVAATAAAMALSFPASAETDDAIARLLAETAANKHPSAARPGREYKVEPTDRLRPEEERRLIDEIEMLERARAEAEARRAEHSLAQSAPRDAAQTAGLRKTEEERRAADERRRVEQQKRADDARRAAEAAQPQADAERRIAEERRRAEEAEYARMEAEREAEAVQIDEALRKARAARVDRQRTRTPTNPAPADSFGTRPAPAHGSPAMTRDVAQQAPDTRDHAGPADRYADSVTPAATDELRSSTRVTVLIVLEPGDRGIRRHNKSADPLLCGEKGCYVGTGAATPADFLPRHRAFGATRTLGDRAGACRNSLGCVFRGIDLVAYPAVIQPIDMRFLRHDRREPHVLDEASRCRLDAGRLSCAPVAGPDYVMWVVPEQIAEQAGPQELTRVVAAGLRAHSAAIVVRN